MKNITFLATTISVFALAGAAHAQTSAQTPQAETGAGIGEIIVTAQRRAESLQKAAIPIDAVRGDALVQRGISNAADLTKAVPALSIPAPGGSVASIFIRGVGNITTSSYNDPAVTPSFDGVVLGRSGGMFGAAFYDLARVEVLKGPQGILYGRNATGGAINVLPARPELGKNGMGVNLAYGNYNQVDVDAHVNLATGEHSALRIAGALFSHDGYNKDGTDDAKRRSLRAQFLYEPSSDLSLRIGGDYSHVGGLGVGGDYLGSFAPSATGYVFTPSGLSAGEGFNSAASNAYRKTQLGGPGMDFRQAMQSALSQNITYWGVHAEANVQTSIGKLTVIPAYRDTQEHSIIYAPAFNTGSVNESTNQTSLETRLAGKRGMMDYVLGGFYFKENIRASNIYNQEFVLPIQNYRVTTESWALFGQLTAHIGNSFRLVGGARYTHDTKSIDGLINNIIVSCANTTTPPFCIGQMPHMPNLFSADAAIGWLGSNGYINPSAGFTVPGSNATAGTVVYGLNSGAGQIVKTYNNIKQSSPFSRVTWKVSAEYDVAPTSLLYATVETGYRAGGYQMVDSPSKIQYKPEFITAFTVGSKNRFFNNRVQLNLEGFYWKYRDQQIAYFTVDSNGTLINSNENAGRSTIKGFDVDLVVKPASGTTLSGKVQYLDTVYNDLHLTSASPFDNFNCPSSLTGTFSNGAPVKSFNCSGRPLLFSPKWTVNLGAEQVIRVDEKRELVANVNTAWRDDQWAAFEFLDFEHVAAYWTTDASLALRSAEGGWSLTAYVQNLENKRRNLAPQSSPMGFAIAHYSAPRTFGLRLSAKF
ncbi:iron complex outermembrane receptor protein [Novosphingobium sp. SG751A]|uniref:TonB-dependent receptor n=1 Tax=Novosphingobium sp. SG751A TaxID=2587000 RepID=UPI0015569073|nr:TonB-dependent receptor [Novosphingobium sp. SG751A]NOW45226.1 iron complex outermembrane receptor protein [Novosphingobium sp. SG751A]